MNLKNQLSAICTDDFQNRRGDYPRSNKPDTIDLWTNSLIFSFKNTTESSAIKWVKNYLSQKSLDSYVSIEAEQDGDYQDDWVNVEVTYKL